MAPTPVLLPGKSHGRRSLVGCGPWGHEELDTTERLHFHFSLSCIGEGNGNPLQCSCLENPRDGVPGGLPSMGLHRVGHDWSDLATAAAADRYVNISIYIYIYIFMHRTSAIHNQSLSIYYIFIFTQWEKCLTMIVLGTCKFCPKFTHSMCVHSGVKVESGWPLFPIWCQLTGLKSTFCTTVLLPNILSFISRFHDPKRRDGETIVDL